MQSSGGILSPEEETLPPHFYFCLKTSGGLYEVTLLALIFGFDVAFVAFNHITRVVLIFLSMPMVVGNLKRS